MIREISIQNFKSVEDLQLNPGRVTVLIGENGSGKSNILEGIAMMGAAAAGKLDDEFLSSRGIRAADESLMLSAFEIRKGKKAPKKNVRILLSAKNQEAAEKFILTRSNEHGAWSQQFDVEPSEVSKFFPDGLPDDIQGKILEILRKSEEKSEKTPKEKRASIKMIEKSIHEVAVGLMKYFQMEKAHEAAEKTMNLGRFLIYGPENSALRRFEDEGQIQPLGIRGEGLFKLLQSFGAKDSKKRLEELKSSLELTGWFLDFSIPSNLAPGESRLRIHDRYLGTDIEMDQRSANEGFLFLLFYFALFLSRDTPRFFAIDNIDSSLNPRLCAALMRRICDLAKTYDKQVIVTTHNPALLDGLDLQDEEQRLYAVSRNEDGRTKCLRVIPPKPREGELPLKLSHAFLRGLIGGLPKNF